MKSTNSSSSTELSGLSLWWGNLEVQPTFRRIFGHVTPDDTAVHPEAKPGHGRDSSSCFYRAAVWTPISHRAWWRQNCVLLLRGAPEHDRTSRVFHEQLLAGIRVNFEETVVFCFRAEKRLTRSCIFVSKEDPFGARRKLLIGKKQPRCKSRTKKTGTRKDGGSKFSANVR